MRDRTKTRERGVTLPLMVFAIVIVLGMAALAIDVATLYVAKSEAQRAADAAALAAARAFITAAVTTAPGDLSAQSVAIDIAQQQATAVVQQNNIAGHPGQLVPPLANNPVFSWGSPSFSNPTVQVSVEQNNLPTFFSRIWSRAPHSVSATAIAEGYNPSGSSSNPAVTVQCVKPFIVPNCDPAQPGTSPCSGHDPFIDSAGAILHPGRATAIPPGVVGELITFEGVNLPNPGIASGRLQFVPAKLPAATSGIFCPSCAGSGVTQFETDISCCNTAALACNSASGNTTLADLSTSPGSAGGPLDNGLQCLTHDLPPGGMDRLDPTGFPSNPGNPFRFQAGSNNPLHPRINTNDLISTSDSLITLLIYDGATINPPGTVNVVGYMQVFVSANNHDGTFTGYIVNVAGCGNTARPGTPISGGGASPVAVRLIHN